MFDEKFKVFLEKTKVDTSLQVKLKAAIKVDEGIAVAEAAGFSITSEDIQSTQLAYEEVLDNELEGAAGGNERTSGTRGCSQTMNKYLRCNSWATKPIR